MLIKEIKKVVLRIVIIILAVIFFFVFPIVTAFLYRRNFGKRFVTPEWKKRSENEFPGLKIEQCTFPTDKGHTLAGYKVSKDNQNVKGIIVIAHGYACGGFNTYMDVADYFTSNGYLVFAYDITGCDNSEGKKVYGLPQGVIDLDHALNYVKSCPQYKGLPVMLFGHSWGGYSVTNVLNVHPDVKAVVSVAGFNKSTDIIKDIGRKIAGVFVYPALPYIALFEKIKFKTYASYTAEKGFNNSNASVMIFQSENDSLVRPKFGYNIWYKDYCDNPRFKFKKNPNRGHSRVYYTDESYKYKKQYDKDYKSYLTANNLAPTKELAAEYAEKHLNLKKYYELDEDVMGDILQFYNASN